MIQNCRDIPNIHIELICSFQWVAGPLVEGRISFGSEPVNDARMTPVVTIPKCVAPILFTSQILRAVWQSPRDQEVDESGDVKSSTLDLKLMLDVAYGIAFCRTVLGTRRKVMTDLYINLQLYYSIRCLNQIVIICRFSQVAVLQMFRSNSCFIDVSIKQVFYMCFYSLA